MVLYLICAIIHKEGNEFYRETFCQWGGGKGFTMPYKVLIADDEPIMRKAMQTLIDWDSLECELSYVAATGQEVLEQLRTNSYDILILDIQMPGANGLDIARYVMEKKLSSKIILLTAYADFSYAQSAIKYNVVDYVVKSGAFEGLVAAIKTARTQLQEEKGTSFDESKELQKESFFKSVFDGFGFQEELLVQTARKLGLDLFEGWVVVVISFHLRKDKERDYIDRSLRNFLKTVFEGQMVFSTALKENILVAVLSAKTEEEQKNLHSKYLQIVEMMDNFMKMQVFVGISERCANITQLKKAYDEAAYAMEEGLFYETSKINYYQGVKREKKKYLEEADKYLKKVKQSIRKGNRKSALEYFDSMVTCLQENNSTVDVMLDFGIEIKSHCEKVLLEYDRTLFDILPLEKDASKLIYACRHVHEYVRLIRNIITATADHMECVLTKKNILIYEAEKYIEENYDKYITVSEVARNVGVSLSYLSRIYKEQTGKNLIQSINERKLEKAQEYLQQTDMKIYEIADALGFENVTYFSSFFKKHTGVSPKEYSEQKRTAAT